MPCSLWCEALVFLLFDGLGTFVPLFTKLQEALISYLFCIFVHTSNLLALCVGHWGWRFYCWHVNGGAHLRKKERLSWLGVEEEAGKKCVISKKTQ